MEPSKRTAAAIGGIIAVVAALAVFSNYKSQTATSLSSLTPGQYQPVNGQTGGETSNTSGGGGVSTASAYTLAQVSAHSDAASCWTAINGNVYDLTAWIGQHPGGEGAILSICGTDGSAAFNAQHGGQRRPETELANFMIGTLSN